MHETSSNLGNKFLTSLQNSPINYVHRIIIYILNNARGANYFTNGWCGK